MCSEGNVWYFSLLAPSNIDFSIPTKSRLAFCSFAEGKLSLARSGKAIIVNVGEGQQCHWLQSGRYKVTSFWFIVNYGEI